MDVSERYITDAAGNRVEVILDIATYRQFLEAFEEIEAIRAYDAAKASGDEALLFEQAVAEIERNNIRSHRSQVQYDC